MQSILLEFFCSIRLKRNKVIGFWEDVAPLLEDDEFRRFYRMNAEHPKSFNRFLSILKGGLIKVEGSKSHLPKWLQLQLPLSVVKCHANK